MAFVTATDIRTENGFAARVAAYLDEKRSAYAKYRMYRRTVNELSALSGAELADLGLSRGSITSVAYEAVYGN